MLYTIEDGSGERSNVGTPVNCGLYFYADAVPSTWPLEFSLCCKAFSSTGLEHKMGYRMRSRDFEKGSPHVTKLDSELPSQSVHYMKYRLLKK